MTLEQFKDTVALACEILENKYDHSYGFIKHHHITGVNNCFTHIFFVGPNGHHLEIGVITTDLFGNESFEITNEKTFYQMVKFVDDHQMYLIALCAMKETIWN